MTAAQPAPPLAAHARLEAHEPPEVRGRDRADVALMVGTRGDGALAHTRFEDLPRFLGAGDLLVVNTSATLAAALPARLAERRLELRLSTPAGAGTWVVELRSEDLGPFRRPPIGAVVELPEGGRVHLLARYAGSDRLSVARLDLPGELEEYLYRHGRPIRYDYLDAPQPIEAYQTIFAAEAGSAEMPSAGRPFTTGLVTELVSRGVLLAPITLHTGVSSLEARETPYPERYRVPETTAGVVNAVHGWGGRVIAIGTTVARALETVAGDDGQIQPGEGSTGLVLAPERGLRAVDGLLTGWHEPESSHLTLLEAAAGPRLLARSYAAAGALGYRWHEFGDSHLILP